MFVRVRSGKELFIRVLIGNDRGEGGKVFGLLKMVIIIIMAEKSLSIFVRNLWMFLSSGEWRKGGVPLFEWEKFLRFGFVSFSN